MKKYLFLALAMIGIAATTLQVQAQTNKFSTTVQTLDTATNADTIYVTVTEIPSKVKSVQITLTRLTGAIPTAGYALLQYSNDRNTWFNLNTDTLWFADAAFNSKVHAFTSTSYSSYRAVFRFPSGTQTSVGSVTYCRRPDE